MARKSNPSSQTATDWQAIDAQISAFHDLVDADGINCARRRRDRWTGALTILLLIALIALALRDFPSATPATCQPPGTLTKATL